MRAFLSCLFFLSLCVSANAQSRNYVCYEKLNEAKTAKVPTVTFNAANNVLSWDFTNSAYRSTAQQLRVPLLGSITAMVRKEKGQADSGLRVVDRILGPMNSIPGVDSAWVELFPGLIARDGDLAGDVIVAGFSICDRPDKNYRRCRWTQIYVCK